MADAKLTALTAATSWASGDLLYLGSDPGGTPASRKITLDNVLSKIVCAANAKAIGVTGYSLTGTNTTPMIDLAGTWNTTGIPTALKVAITNTASGTRSLLASFAATSLGSFEFEKTGELLIGWDGSAGSSTGMKGVHGVSGGVMHFGCTNGGAYIGNTASLGASARVDNSFIKIRSDMSFAWSVDTTSYGATSLALAYDAANTLALRNSTNAQTFNVYGTYTSGSVYERGAIYADSNGFNIEHQQLGATKRPVRILGHSLASAEAVSALEILQTWNTTGTPTAFKLNITNTASNAASKLMDLQVGGSGRVWGTARGDLYVSWNGTPQIALAPFGSAIVLDKDQSISWTAAATVLSSPELTILRDAANTLALRNSTNAQTLNVYGTYTSGSVYERMFMRYSSGNTRFEIGTEHTGATARDLELMVPAAKIVGMDKTTEDNGFINFKATADADATSAISTLTTSGAVTHHIQVKINGVKAWIPCSTTNPS